MGAPSQSPSVTAPPKGEPLAGRVTFHWTPEARYGVEGRALLQRAGFPLYNLSVSLRSTAPLVGEPLAKPFTLRGLPKPPLQGEVARRQPCRRGCTKTEPSLCRKVRLVAALPVSFCRSLWYTCFAPGARALTPDQQDGAGKKTCCCCRRTCFFKLYADKLEKRRFTQNVQPQKNCGLLWHYR